MIILVKIFLVKYQQQAFQKFTITDEVMWK